jgi:hypothetical protein
VVFAAIACRGLSIGDPHSLSGQDVAATLPDQRFQEKFIMNYFALQVTRVWEK